MRAFDRFKDKDGNEKVKKHRVQTTGTSDHPVAQIFIPTHLNITMDARVKKRLQELAKTKNMTCAAFANSILAAYAQEADNEYNANTTE